LARLLWVASHRAMPLVDRALSWEEAVALVRSACTRTRHARSVLTRVECADRDYKTFGRLLDCWDAYNVRRAHSCLHPAALTAVPTAVCRRDCARVGVHGRRNSGGRAGLSVPLHLSRLDDDRPHTRNSIAGSACPLRSTRSRVCAACPWRRTIRALSLPPTTFPTPLRCARRLACRPGPAHPRHVAATDWSLCHLEPGRQPR
jgi:hypothetical protein